MSKVHKELAQLHKKLHNKTISDGDPIQIGVSTSVEIYHSRSRLHHALASDAALTSSPSAQVWISFKAKYNPSQKVDKCKVCIRNPDMSFGPDLLFDP